MAPDPLTLLCLGQAAGNSWLLRAGGNGSVFSPQSHHGTRDPEALRAARHQQLSPSTGVQLCIFKSVHCLVFAFQADARLYSSSELFADLALI